MSYSSGSVSTADNVDSETLTYQDPACEIQNLMRCFLKEHTAYDVLPVSYRLIVFDTRLLVKKALNVLVQNGSCLYKHFTTCFLYIFLGIVSAPLWSSETQKFSGMLTVADFINLIQYYYTHSSVDEALKEMENFELAHLRNVEKQVGAPAPQLVSMNPMSTLYDACKLLAESRAHRVPLLDKEPGTGTETIVSVITQYRILKFIASNVRMTHLSDNAVTHFFFF